MKVCIFLCLISLINAKYNCYTKNVAILKLNEIAFFETNNYPKFMSKKDFTSCNITFMLEDGNYKNPSILAFIGNYSDNSNYYTTEVWSENNSSTFTFPSNIPKHILAAHGYIIFVERAKTECPLESIAGKTPFEFIDETQILYFASDYNKNIIRNKSCKWKFSAPNGFGFKIVIEFFNISLETELTVKNNTDILFNQRSVKLLHPYYNSDNFIEIYLSKGNPNFQTLTEFRGYIAIVKTDFKLITDNCIITENGNTTFWNYSIGYENNMYCKYELIIPPNYEIFIKTEHYSLEWEVDFVKYTNDENETFIIKSWTTFNLHNFRRNSNKTVMFEFFSDGSVQYMGFSLSFVKIYCQCDYSTIPCDGQRHRPMKNTGNYCGNLNCRFIIESCSSDYSSMQITYSGNIAPYFDNYDIFKVISNNETVLEINNSNEHIYAFTIYLKSSNENIFKILTFPSDTWKSMQYLLRTFIVPQIYPQVILSSQNPLYLMDTGMIDLATVEILNSAELKNDTIKIHSSIDSGIPLYEDSSLTKSLNTSKCFTNGLTCDTKRRKVAIYSNNTKYPILVIQLSSKFYNHFFLHKKIRQKMNTNKLKSVLEKNENCIFHETVFTANQKISAISNSYGKCRIIILVTEYNIYTISHLFTTALTEKVKVFIGINLTNPFFEFDSKTSSIWKNITLFSPVYSIEIPKNSAIFITLKKINGNIPTIVIPQKYPYQSIVSTLNYGVSKSINFFWPIFITYEIGNFPVKFTALNYNIQIPDIFCFVINDTFK